MGEFYKRKFVKIIIPFVIYSLFYAVWVNNDIGITDVSHINTWIQMVKEIPNSMVNILKTYQSVHLWFMYSIIGIYLVIPFIKTMVQNLDENAQKSMFILFIVMSTLFYYFPIIFELKIGISDYIWKGWIVYVLLGYILVQPWIQKYYSLIEWIAIVAYVISVIVYIWFPEYTSSYIYDLAPSMILQACGFWVFLYRRENLMCKRPLINQLMSIISKYTFSIYLIHEYIRVKIEEFHIVSRITSDAFATALMTIFVTFVLSFFAAFVIDNSVVKFIQFLALKLGEKTRCLFSGKFNSEG